MERFKIQIRLIGGVIILMMITYICKAQDPVFSQYDNNAAFLNPGKFSRFSKKTAAFNQRFQSSVDTQYNTSQFTFVLPIYQQKNYTERSNVNHLGGIGFSFLNDVSDGSFKTTSANISFAYNWKLDPKMQHMVSFGLSPGFIKLSVDLNDYTWGEQYREAGFDPNYTPGSIPDEDRATVFDVGFGTYWTFRNTELELNGIRNIDAGISLNHINSPNISTINNNKANLPVMVKMHASVYYALNEKLFTGIKLLYLHQQKNKRANIGGTFGANLEKSGDYISRIGKSEFGFILREFYFDAWVSTSKSFGLATTFDFTNYQLGFSYEPNYSTFSVVNKTGSAFELFLLVNLPDKK